VNEELREGGTVRPLTLHGADVLHRRCAEVTVFDDALVTLVRDMFATMYDAPGVGLAANQIGVDQRVFVIDCPDARGERLIGHVVNPVLTIVDETPDPGSEGCLSVPGARADLARASVAVVEGVDVEGNPVRLEGHGYAARCLQHETDHLDGTVYVDRLAPALRRLALEAHQEHRLQTAGFAFGARGGASA